MQRSEELRRPLFHIFLHSFHISHKNGYFLDLLRVAGGIVNQTGKLAVLSPFASDVPGISGEMMLLPSVSTASI